MVGVRFFDLDFMRINLACEPPTVWLMSFSCTVGAGSLGAARAGVRRRRQPRGWGWLDPGGRASENRIAIERNPRFERGSFNIARSLLFRLHSRSAVSIHILP